MFHLTVATLKSRLSKLPSRAQGLGASAADMGLAQALPNIKITTTKKTNMPIDM